MHLISALEILILCEIIYVFTQNDAPGKVFIGSAENDTTTNYSFSVNQPSTLHQIPVYVEIYNASTQSVTVTCGLSPAVNGYSRATFAERTITTTGSSGSPYFGEVSFNSLIPGRTTDVYCWCISPPPFTKETTISDARQFTIVPGAVVNVYSRVYTLGQPIYVKLSQVAVNNSVVVTCAGSGLTFAQTTVDIGSSQIVQVLYTVQSIADAVTVSCRGQSSNGGTQFLNETSTGTDALVVRVAPAVSMIPTQTILKRTRMQVIISINQAPTDTSTFSCSVSTVYSLADAMNITNQVGCSNVPQPTPTPLRPGTESSVMMTTQGTESTVMTTTQGTETTVMTTTQGTESSVTLTTQGTESSVMMTTQGTESSVMLTTQGTESTVMTTTQGAESTVITTTQGTESSVMLTTQGTESTVMTTTQELTSTTLLSTTSPTVTTAGFTFASANSSLPISSLTSTNMSGNWLLQPTDFTFAATDGKSYLFRVLELYRAVEVTSYTEELVVTRCCSSEPTSNNPFLNSAASVVAAVALTPTLFINWTIATATGNISVETPIVNPAFRNLAPCPCNLTASACDANCCCDTDCTESDVAVFQCIEGFFGGRKGEKSHDFCGATYYDTPGWFPIMCIHDENNGFLGYFFYPAGLIRNQTTFDNTLAPHLSDYSFRQTRFILPGEPDGSQAGYKEGLAIKTGLQIPPSFFIGPNYMLTLPQPGMHGHPIWSAPVRFLVSTDAFWVQDMSQSGVLCSVISPLSAATYAQSPTWGIANGPMVLKEQGVAVVTSINVNFLCDPDASRYLSSRSTYEDLVPINVTKLFGTASDDANNCRFDDVTGAYVCGNSSVGSGLPQNTLPPRCSWDDGYHAPPNPEMNNDSNTCDNSVVRVFYNFTWSGQSVLSLNVTLILSNVTLPTNSSGAVDERSVMLSQRFVTQFVSQRGNSTGSSEENGGMKVTPRSGNPGYNMNLPVISGISVLGNGSSDVPFIDTNSSSRLSIWNPGAGSLCEGAQRMPVLFGVGSMGECLLRLSFANLQNCDLLRKQVLSGQDSLMPSNYISLVGNPSADNFSDWTNIIRQDISYIVNSTRPSNTLSTEQTTQTTTASFSLPPFHNYYAELKGSCHNMPSGIDLMIMYAVAGRSNNQPIHRIVGAKISYTLSTWRWRCAGESGASCHDNSTLVQSFGLTSTVSFLQVPATPQPAPSRYKQDVYVPHRICKGGICWKETFYPFQELNGWDNQRQIALGLAFLIFIIYFTVITSPLLGDILKIIS